MNKRITMIWKKIRRKHVIGVLALVTVVYISMSVFTIEKFCQAKRCEENIIKMSHTNFADKSTKKVLVWTKFFLGDWADYVSGSMSRSRYNCSVTADRSELGSVDAVLFHFIDLWFWETVPGFRRPDQVWVLYNMEPPPHHHFTGKPWIQAFNWTMTYRTDATIPSPYGEFVPLTREERETATLMYKDKNFAVKKTKMAVAVVSNCQDDVQRYRYIRQLEKYVDIDYFGNCGRLTCPRTNNAECDDKKYRFRIAFENSNCKDYVTEKFWKSLKQESVPIVNWGSDQVINAPKNSYINIHDFKSAKELGSYMNMLSTNDKLYNKYFAWKTHYKPESQEMYAFRYLCDALHTPRLAQTIVDPNKWLRTDSCRTWSIREVLRRHLDRFMFDYGW